MQRGQKPKNAQIKLVTGNPGKRTVNKSEPKPAGEVRKPPFVKGKAAKLWEQYVPDLVKKGVLTAWDVDMFGAWCCEMADYQKDRQAFTSSRFTQMRTLGEAFGLIPPGRARLKPNVDEEEKDAAAKYIG